jgi:protein gp37
MIEVIGPEIGVASAARDWWDIQWQLLRGCTRVSSGCEHCSAEIMVARDPAQQGYARLRKKGDPHDARWTGTVDTIPEALAELKTWREPLRIFVCSMSDLFHETVPFGFIAQAIEAMGAHPQNTFGICTKRAMRMADFFKKFGPAPPNVMVGVTIEHSSYLHRAVFLAAIAAQIRWVAVEPALGDVAEGLLPHLRLGHVNWVTFGPEIGVSRRECDPEWARKLLAACRTTGTPFFTKHLLDGKAIRELP